MDLNFQISLVQNVSHLIITVTLTPSFLQLLTDIESYRIAWAEKCEALQNASDEVWLAQMDEVSRLENRYRNRQDELCKQLAAIIDSSSKNKSPTDVPLHDQP